MILRITPTADPPRAAGAQVLDTARALVSPPRSMSCELARGIHPAILTERGLPVRSRSPCARAPARARDGRVDLVRAAAAPVEAAAYFLVAEALTNVVRYADATRADVKCHAENDTLAVTIQDDGRGGADPRARLRPARHAGSRSRRSTARWRSTARRAREPSSRAVIPCAS